MNFWQILAAVAPVFLIIGTGSFLRLLGWMKPEADSSLLKVGVNVLFPALITDTILGNPLLSRVADLWMPPLLGFALIAISFLCMMLILKPLRLPEDTFRAGIVSAGMQNYGYLVIPLVESLYDRETLGVLFLHNLGVETAMWSLAVWILSNGRAGSFWKHVLNIPVLAIVCSGILNLLQAHQWLPSFFCKSAHLLGQAAIPLALLLTGATLYDLAMQRTNGKTTVSGLSVALCARLILLPILFLLAVKAIPMGTPLQRVLVLQAAMPSAMMPAVLCRLHGSDARFSLQIILATTFIGLLSIPLWLKFGLNWFALAQ